MKDRALYSGQRKDRLRRGLDSLAINASRWLPRSEGPFLRSPHFWVITALIGIITFLYYIDQMPIAANTSLAGVHDFQRTLFLIPIIYSALVFRARGSLITSFAFLIAILPRALFFSPYPDPLLRALLFFVIASLISLLIASHLNRVEEEKRALEELKKAYEQLKDSQQQLIQAEKLASLGQMAACIAHEVNNPLAGVLAYTQLLSRKLGSGDISREDALNYLSKIELETARSGKLVRSLVDFSRQSPPAFNLIDINEVIERALDLAIHSSKGKNIEVVKVLCQPLPGIVADFDQLQQVFVNLILNAIQAMPGGGTLTINTSASKEGVYAEVKDSGCGIPPENIDKLFTPFFTTKQEVQGVGLGLAVAYGIVQRHHGNIEIESRQGEGSTFTVFLPFKQKEAV